MQVQPGTAQEIPQIAKWIILGIAIVAVVLVSTGGRLWPWFKSLFIKKK